MDAVIGVLGVFALRFGGGVVVLRSSTSPEGTGNDEILLLKGVPRGSRFKGGSRMGCRFFLLECCCAAGGLESDPAPTVKPLRCRIDPVLFLIGFVFTAAGTADSGSPRWLTVPAWAGTGGADGGDMFDFEVEVENAKVLRSGSLGDSKAFGMAGTGGTSSSSPPAELWTFLDFGVGSREPEMAALGRKGALAFPTFSEFKLELDDIEMPEAYDFRCSGVARAEEGVMLWV